VQIDTVEQRTADFGEIALNDAGCATAFAGGVAVKTAGKGFSWLDRACALIPHTVTLAGIPRHPAEQWMVQMARNATDEIEGAFRPFPFVHDRDTKVCASFRATLSSGGVEPPLLPARSPNLNAFAERWV